MSTIIVKTSNVMAKIKAVNKKMTTLNEDLRVLMVSTAWHFMMHRDPSTLNRFFGILPEAYKAGVKRWIGNEMLRAMRDVMLDAKVGDLPFTLSKDEFKVKAGTVDLTNYLAKYIDDHQDEVGFGSFMDINPDKEKSPFDLTKIEHILVNLVKKAEKNPDNLLTDRQIQALKETVATFKRKAETPEVVDVVPDVTLYKGGDPRIVEHHVH